MNKKHRKWTERQNEREKRLAVWADDLQAWEDNLKCEAQTLLERKREIERLKLFHPMFEISDEPPNTEDFT